MRGSGRSGRVSSCIVVGRRRLDELPQPTDSDHARSHDPVTAAVRARVDPSEIDVSVDGAERRTQGRKDDQHDQSHR